MKSNVPDTKDAAGGGGARAAGAGRVTLKEIASKAGVSISTASLVLSGKATQRRISTEIERRVRRIALEHDYSPNLLVRSMQQGRTHVLSFYNAYRERKRGDLYMDRLSTALEQAAGRHGYDLLLHCNYRRSEDEIYRFLNGGLCDGLVFYGPLHADPLIDLLRASRLPIVILDHMDAEGVLSSVCDDWRGGMRQIAECLHAHGHVRIGAVEGFPASDARLRIGALREELGRLGLALPEENVETAYQGFRTPDEALERLLARPEPPTALFCWHDRVGYEVLEACDRLGVRVPHHLSLIGYDGVHWPSTSPHILASVAVPLEDLADAAVHLLDDLIEGRRERPVQEIYPVSLLTGTTLSHPPA